MVNCIGALVRRRDGDTSVVMILDTDFYDSNNKKQQGSKNRAQTVLQCLKMRPRVRTFASAISQQY